MQEPQRGIAPACGPDECLLVETQPAGDSAQEHDRKVPLEREHRQHPVAPAANRLDPGPDVGLAERFGPRHLGRLHRGLRAKVEDLVVGPVGLLRKRIVAAVNVGILRHVLARRTHELVRFFHGKESEQFGDALTEPFAARKARCDKAAVGRERIGDGSLGRRVAFRREWGDIDDAGGSETWSIHADAAQGSRVTSLRNPFCRQGNRSAPGSSEPDSSESRCEGNAHHDIPRSSGKAIGASDAATASTQMLRLRARARYCGRGVGRGASSKGKGSVGPWRL